MQLLEAHGDLRRPGQRDLRLVGGSGGQAGAGGQGDGGGGSGEFHLWFFDLVYTEKFPLNIWKGRRESARSIGVNWWRLGGVARGLVTDSFGRFAE